MATVLGSLVRATLLAAAGGQLTARVPPYAEGIEQVLAAYAAATGGYGFAVGVVDGGVAWGAGAGQRTTVGAGLPPIAPGDVTADDTFVLGSGTKPYTAAGVMLLVERGELALADSAAAVTAGLMQYMWNTSLIELFGPTAAAVTVEHLVRMQSGLMDIESVPGWEQRVLTNGSVHNPLWDLQAVAGLGKQAWQFPPGTQTEYCSTNYLLAGLVLLSRRPRAEWSWESFDQRRTLDSPSAGPFLKRYPRTFFPTAGPLDKGGLSLVGNAYSFGRAAIWSQDAGIMGTSWGNAAVSAVDVARFYMELLGPVATPVLNSTSRAFMEDWRLLTFGWDKGTKRYGAGLETNNPSPQVQHWRAPPLDHVSTGIGHHGATYGFEMLGGFYPKLNVSITVATNQDAYASFVSGIACAVVEVLARHRLGVPTLNCTQPRKVTYSCNAAIKACAPACLGKWGAHCTDPGTTFAACAAAACPPPAPPTPRPRRR